MLENFQPGSEAKSKQEASPGANRVWCNRFGSQKQTGNCSKEKLINPAKEWEYVPKLKHTREKTAPKKLSKSNQSATGNPVRLSSPVAGRWSVELLGKTAGFKGWRVDSVWLVEGLARSKFLSLSDD